MRGDTRRLGKICEPEGEVEERIAVFEERPSSGFRFVVSPALHRSELILAGTHSNDATELAALKKSRELLNVASKAMIVSDDDFAIGSGSSSENALHTTGRERQRSLAKHVNFLLERAQHVRLVQVVRSCDDDCIELVGVEKLVDVREDVGNTKTLGERTSFWTVVVTDRDKLRAANAGENRKMRQLRYRSRANKSKSDVRAQMCPTVVPW